MSSQRKTTSKTKKTAPRDSSRGSASSTVYDGFSVWTSRSRPKWHPVKKMRYVFWRMIAGCTITDAIAELRWNPAEFWHLVDLKRHDPFREEYKRAKILQGRALADHVLTIAEGRDRISRRRTHRMQKLIAKAIRRAGRTKNRLVAKHILETIMSRYETHESTTLQRNKLQMDGTKWLAKAVNPIEFSEKTQLALGTPPGDGKSSDESDDVLRPIQIQFVGPNGKVMKL